MVDRTQLTEALAILDRAKASGMEGDDWATLTTVRVLEEAARLLLDFPTDEMVRVVSEWVPCVDEDAQALLEAVRRVMYGETE